MTEENLYLSQKKVAQALSLHHNTVKKLSTAELSLRRVNSKWVPRTLTASQKLESVKISWKLFGRFNKLQVNDLGHVITGNETWVYFENPRSAMWAGVDARHPNRPNQLIGAKKVIFWMLRTPLGIVDIVTFPPGETFNRSFFVRIVLDSLKKKLAQIPDLNPAKGHVLHLDNAKLHLADHQIQANNFARLSHPSYSPDLAPVDFWLLGI
jgi:hypothetical protein